jgi:hypothetical protein
VRGGAVDGQAVKRSCGLSLQAMSTYLCLRPVLFLRCGLSLHPMALCAVMGPFIEADSVS